VLAVLAAFFCLLFFAAAKKSRCRPAQGRRLKQAKQIADASAKAKKPNRLRSKHRHADPSKNLNKPTSVADNQKTITHAQ
jgi:hypothetical protein